MNVRFTKKPPFVERIPEPLRPYGKAGKVDAIFRPRILRNGMFATATGYGVTFSPDGVDSEGLDRAMLDSLTRTIAGANRMLPLECVVYEHCVITDYDEIPARPIEDEVIRRHREERHAYLKANAKFKNVQLFVTLYMPGKVGADAEDFAENSRTSLRQLWHAASRYEHQLRKFGIRRLTGDEVVQLYSYLLNLEKHLITRKAAPPRKVPKKLGRVHIGVEGHYLRVGKRYCQVLSLSEMPRAGTRPDLWGSQLMTVDCEQVWCSVWQRKPSGQTRAKAAAVENALGLAVMDIWSSGVNGYNPYLPPPRRATTVAQENKVEKLGGTLTELDDQKYYGHYSLFGLVHARDKDAVEAVLPRIHAIISDPSEAAVIEEKRGAVSAFLSCFPGQPYNVRHFWLRGDHKANLSFVYRPFPGHPQSSDLGDEYTLVYETRQGTPFYMTPFVNGNGNTTFLGAPNRGKSLNVNAVFSSAMKYKTKTFIFDQHGSYETNVRDLGGSVTHLGLTRPRINIFNGEPTKDNIFSISHVVRLMLLKSGYQIDNEAQDAIEKGVERMMLYVPRELRRLQNLRLPIDLKPGLKRWTEGGIYGEIFDNVEDDLEFHDLQLFDFMSLSEKHNDLLEVEMSWILTLCQNIIRDPNNMGVPKHIVLDELWKRTGVLPVVTFLLETLKADRKHLAWASLVTQSLEDLGQYAAVVKNACPTTVFLGGAFDRELYRKHFSLNPRQLEQFTSLAERELAIKVDGEPFVNGGTGYFKVLRMNLDPSAYARATTKPAERVLRDTPGGLEKVKELAEYRGR